MKPSHLNAERKAFDARYRLTKTRLNILGRRIWRKDYLYPLMRTTAFSDFETLLEMGCEKLSERLSELLEREQARRTNECMSLRSGRKRKG